MPTTPADGINSEILRCRSSRSARRRYLRLRIAPALTPCLSKFLPISAPLYDFNFNPKNCVKASTRSNRRRHLRLHLPRSLRLVFRSFSSPTLFFDALLRIAPALKPCLSQFLLTIGALSNLRGESALTPSLTAYHAPFKAHITKAKGFLYHACEASISRTPWRAYISLSSLYCHSRIS